MSRPARGRGAWTRRARLHSSCAAYSTEALYVEPRAEIERRAATGSRRVRCVRARSSVTELGARASRLYLIISTKRGIETTIFCYSRDTHARTHVPSCRPRPRRAGPRARGLPPARYPRGDRLPTYGYRACDLGSAPQRVPVGQRRDPVANATETNSSADEDTCRPRGQTKFKAEFKSCAYVFHKSTFQLVLCCDYCVYSHIDKRTAALRSI